MNDSLCQSATVVGAGSWGTALALLLAERLPSVTLWCREPEVAEGIHRHHRNPLFLPELDLPPHLLAETDLAAAVNGRSLVVVVTPTQFTRAMLVRLRPLLAPGALVVSASKGIELSSLCLVSDLYRQEWGELAERVCYLSGPSFAREVAQRQPTACVVAAADLAVAQAVQAQLSTPWFRVYTSDDVVGVELGGALKNVIALAAGIGAGLGYGSNALAALITRGLAEIGRLCVAKGGRWETVAGLSGLGDLLLTATSNQSRNRTVGQRLGQGEPLAAILAGMREVPEGVATTPAACQLAANLGVAMPIATTVQEILHGSLPPALAVARLMERALKAEHA